MRNLTLLLLPLALLLGGCVSSGDVFAVVTIVGGEKLRVPLSQPVPSARTAELEVTSVRFEAHEQKETLALRCEIKLLKPTPIRRVTVEDITGEQSIVFVDDKAPQFAGVVWKGSSLPLTRADPRIGWLVSLENSIRVFRFTIETVDGRKITLNQPVTFPGFLKEPMRRVLGLTY